MCLMAMTKAKASVIIFSWCAGVMYSTLFTMPYLLVAHYHSEGCVSVIIYVYGEALHLEKKKKIMEFFVLFYSLT